MTDPRNAEQAAGQTDLHGERRMDESGYYEGPDPHVVVRIFCRCGWEVGAAGRPIVARMDARKALADHISDAELLRRRREDESWAISETPAVVDDES